MYRLLNIAEKGLVVYETFMASLKETTTSDVAFSSPN